MLGGFFAVGGCKGSLGRIVTHMTRDPVQHTSHADVYARLGNVRTERGGAVGGFENRFGDILPHFANVNIEGSNHLQVRGDVATKIPVHETDRVVGTFVGVVLNALNERTRTVADTHNRDFDSAHRPPSSLD